MTGRTMPPNKAMAENNPSASPVDAGYAVRYAQRTLRNEPDTGNVAPIQGAPNPKRWFTDALALLAGLLFPLAFAPFQQSWLAMLCLAALFYTWHDASPKAAAWRGYLFGLGQFGFGVSWVYVSMHDFGGASPMAAGLLTALFVACFALYPALAGYLSRYRSHARRGNASVDAPRPEGQHHQPASWTTWFHNARQLIGLGDLLKVTREKIRDAERPGLRSHAERGNDNGLCLLVIFPMVWILVEWLRGWLFTGFPWLQAGYSQINTPLGKLAPLAGVYGVGWLVAFVAACLAAFVCLRGPGRRWWPIAAGVLCLGLGQLPAPSWTQPAGAAIPVALIQGNIPQALKFQPDQQWRTLERYVELTQANWNAKVIVWPETAVPLFYHQLADTFFARLTQAAVEHGSDVLVGVPVGSRDGGADYYNGLVSVGTNVAAYRKRHLVPFGEFLPLKPLLGFVLNILQIPLSDFSAGDVRQPLLQAGGWPLLATVCYEDAFGNEGRVGLPEAAYLVNVSNDAWFGDSIAPHQHLQVAQMRALETGRYMLRATNTGVTALVGPDGKVVKQLPQFEAGVLTGNVTPMAGATPYVRYGDAPVVMLLALLWLGAAWMGHDKRVGGAA
ncbi:MAG: apolipoprotein N-acyltransferase [Methylococcaceae bacterium]|nr:MAG: apolipoprotein N-acyltransferase [Methylococcaceae bacterium]